MAQYLSLGFRCGFARVSLWFMGFLRHPTLDLHCLIAAATVGWNPVNGGTVQMRPSTTLGSIQRRLDLGTLGAQDI